MLIVVLVSGFSLSFGGCNFNFSTLPLAPVRDGLGIATSADGQYVVTVDSTEGLVEVIRSDRLVAQIDVGGEPTDVVLAPDARTVLVTSTNVGSSAGELVLIDLSSNSVKARIPVGSGPTGIALSPDGHIAYVADTGYIGPGNVDVVDLEQQQVVATIPVGKQPVGLALSNDGGRLYVADANLYLPLNPATPTIPGDVSIVDTATRDVISTIPVGIAPLFIALSFDGRELAVGDYGSDAISVIDTSTDSARTVSVPQGSFGVGFSPDGRKIYVSAGHSPLIDEAPGSEKLTNDWNDSVSVVDTASWGVIRSIHVSGDPTGVAVGPDGAVYVARGTFPNVARLAPVTLQASDIGTPGLAPLPKGASK